MLGRFASILNRGNGLNPRCRQNVLEWGENLYIRLGIYIKLPMLGAEQSFHKVSHIR